MFGAKDRNQSSEMSSQTIIAQGVTLRGDIDGADDVQINGDMEGSILKCTKATIGTTGTLRGNIESNQVEVAGNLDGNITADEATSILSGAAVIGNIETGTLNVESGASIAGRVITTRDTSAEIIDENTEKKVDKIETELQTPETNISEDTLEENHSEEA